MKTYAKATLTITEYNSVYNAIVETLEKYGYRYTRHGIETIIDEWLNNNGEMITAIRQHPNYNGNFQLVFSNTSYKSESDRNAGLKFVYWLKDNGIYDDILKHRVIDGFIRSEIYNALVKVQCEIESASSEEELVSLCKERDELCDKLKLFNNSVYTEESLAEHYRIKDFLVFVKNFTSERLGEPDVTIINHLYPEFKAVCGQKVTKIVGKFCKKYGMDTRESYNRAYAKYCDDINVIKITRHTILSWYPVDYLTQSIGNSWASCHTIDKQNILGLPDSYEGQYSSGTISYMLDSTSFVLYTVDEKYNGNIFYDQPKINRCMFHVADNKILQGRCYPQGEDGNADLYRQLRELVQKVMSEIWDVPNYWNISKNDIEFKTRTLGTHYPDYEYSGGCNISTNVEATEEQIDREIVIGHDPICVECGNEHGTSECINCCHNPGAYICSQCGDEIYEDDLIEYNGNYYCVDCCFWCTYHDRYEPTDIEHTEVISYGIVCDNALSEGIFLYCEECEEWYHCNETSVYETPNGFICGNCANHYNYVYVESECLYYPASDVVWCDECEENHLKADMEVTKEGTYVCPHTGVIIEA